MTDWVIDIINQAGYVGLFGLMLVECIFPPIPSEAILPFAGFSVAQGDLDFTLVLMAATAGSIVGNVALYVAGRTGGVPLVNRFGTRVGATPVRMMAFRRWMDRWGGVTIFFARFVPLARTAISVPAGLARYPFGRFLALTAAGSLIWNAALVGTGWALNDAWRRVEETMGPISYAAVALMAVGAVAGIVILRRRAATDAGWRRRRPDAAE